MCWENEALLELNARTRKLFAGTAYRKTPVSIFTSDFSWKKPAEEHLPGIIQAKECMKKKKHISEEQHYLCEIGLEKMPYGSSWLHKSYTEESLTHITITAYYNVGEAFLQASTAAWGNLWDCRAALHKLVFSVYLESDLNLPFGKTENSYSNLGILLLCPTWTKSLRKLPHRLSPHGR